MLDVQLAPSHPHFTTHTGLEAARWALTLLRFNLAKYGLTSHQITSSESHGLLTDEGGAVSPIHGSGLLDLNQVPAGFLGATMLAELMTATITIDVRARMVFGATLDVSFSRRGIGAYRGVIADLLVGAMAEQEAALLARLVGT
ncbi:MAG: hypothetical protein H0T79_10885 [Deltaproteobacteria bacterium]|nr:hypothetical protein [Deltaproteobacteria bacterium]